MNTEIFKNIKKSIYSPGYYHELLAKPFSYSMKYYLLFAVLLSFIVALFFSLAATPELKLLLDESLEKAATSYPAELKVEIKNGQVSTNVQEPYVVKMPEDFKNNEELTINGSKPQDFQNLIVIDTKNDFSNVNQFTSYDTALLLTKDSIIYYNKEGGISIQPLQPGMNFTLEKSGVESFVKKVKPFTVLLYPVMFLGAFLGNFILSLARLIYVFFGALLIWPVVSLQKMKMGYGKSYQMGLHLMTLGILINTLLWGINFYARLHVFPFFFTVLLVIMALVNIKKTPDSLHNVNSQAAAI